MFWNKKQGLNSQEYEDILKRMSKLRADIEEMGLSHAKIFTELRSIRGLYYKKMHKSEDEPIEDTESNKRTDGFDSIRALRKQIGD